jgi:long-chain acyl-CoA synthetase
MMFKRPWLNNYPVRWNLDYPEVSLYEFLKKQTAECKNLIAMIFQSDGISFDEMHDKINRFASALIDLGINKGDRVAIIMPNCPDYIYAYYACMKIGAIEVQVDPLFKPAETELVIRDCEPKIVIVADLVIENILAIRDKLSFDHLIISRLSDYYLSVPGALYFDKLLENYPANSAEVEIDPRSDVAVLQYTGGTTGIPKAAMLTHYNIVSNVIQKREWFSDWLKSKYNNGLRQHYGLAVMPFFHATGMTAVMNFGLTAPFGLLLSPRFDVEATLELIDRYRPVFFMGVPTIFINIANHPDAARHNLKAVDIWRTGGAPLPVEVIDTLEVKFGIKIIEGYGLTEASPTTHANPFRGMRKFGSIGMPYPDTDCRIVDLESGNFDVPVGMEGELIVKGPQVMKGYWKRPDETANTIRDGWLYTGDIARIDNSGFFYIVGRKKDMIITGGLNVYPGEVDEVLFHHPKIAEVVSKGIPDQYFGEALKSYVVIKEGESATEEELLDYCAERLAVYKLPRMIEFCSDLPKSSVGKHLRRGLGEQPSDLAAASVINLREMYDFEDPFMNEDFKEDFS